MQVIQIQHHEVIKIKNLYLLNRLGGRTYSSRVKPHFPLRATPEFLLVDLLNNLDQLAEDPNEVVLKARLRVKTMDQKKLRKSVRDYVV